MKIQGAETMNQEVSMKNNHKTNYFQIGT